MPGGQSVIDAGPTAREIEAALRGKVDALVPELLAGARRDGAYWTVGSVAGEPGTQMKVNRQGPRQGLWTDFSEPEGADARGGDMLQLIAIVHFGGWSRGKDAQQKAIQWALGWLGWENIDRDRLQKVRREQAERVAQADAEAAEEAATKRSRAFAMWRGSVAGAGTPAETYCQGRGIDFRKLGHWPGSLRFLPDCWCSIRKSKHPAMVAVITALDGGFLGVHRTFLDVSAGKGGAARVVKIVTGADGVTRIWDGIAAGKVKSHKLTFGGDYRGGCIPVWKGKSPATLREVPRGTAIYCSEGIEDAATIGFTSPELRTIAAVSLSNLGNVQLPDRAGPLVFIGQHDAIDGKAVEAFERAIGRQQIAAREIGRPDPQIIWPQPQFKDFNDQLLQRPTAGPWATSSSAAGGR